MYLSDVIAGGFTLAAPSFSRQVVGMVAIVDAVVGEVELFVQAETDSGFVRSEPGSGDHPVRSINRLADGTVEIEYDDVAAP